MSKYKLFILITIIFVIWQFSVLAQSFEQSLSVHNDLDTGLTSCNLEAGNGFDLALLSVEQPFVIEVVRFYAQSFPGQGEGSVSLRVYEDNDNHPGNGAILLASVEAVMVAGNSPRPYTVPVNNLRVTQPYLYVILNFTSATVINASSSSQPGGFSFSTRCNESGLEYLRSPITLDDIRLGIEIIGHPEESSNPIRETDSPLPTESTIESSLVSSAVPPTEESVTVTQVPTDSNTFEETATAEASSEPELNSELNPEVSPEVSPEASAEVGDA